MVVLNKLSRFHLVLLALKHIKIDDSKKQELSQICETALTEHTKYVNQHFQDQDYITNFQWTK